VVCKGKEGNWRSPGKVFRFYFRMTPGHSKKGNESRAQHHNGKIEINSVPCLPEDIRKQKEGNGEKLKKRLLDITQSRNNLAAKIAGKEISRGGAYTRGPQKEGQFYSRTWFDKKLEKGRISLYLSVLQLELFRGEEGGEGSVRFQKNNQQVINTPRGGGD